MKKIILIILLSFTFAYAQFPTFSRFPSYLNTASWIPTEGLVLLHNPGAQMISGSPGNRYYPDLTYGSNLVTNGDFHDFTFDNADVEDSVKGHWIFSSVYHLAEIGQDSIHHDLSGLGNDLTLKGWIDYADVKSDMSGTSHPSYENADTLGWDGVTTYWSIAAANTGDFVIGTDAFTVEAWIKTTDGSWDVVAHKGAAGGSHGWTFGFYGSKASCAVVGATASSTLQYGTGSIPIDGNWHHLVSVYTDTTIDFYLDGVHDVQRTFSTVGNIDNSGENFSIGEAVALGWGKSSIAEVRFTKSALSADEIMASYGIGKGFNGINMANNKSSNENFKQGVERSGGGLISVRSSAIAISANTCYEVSIDIATAEVKSNNGRFDIYNNPIVTLFVTFIADQIAERNYKGYFFSGAENDMITIMYGDDNDLSIYDNLIIREVTNVSAPDSVVTDYSGQGNTGYPISDLEDEQPVHPYSWQYDGVADNLDYGDILDVGSNAFIFFTWMRSDISGVKLLFSKWEGSGVNTFQIYSNNDELTFYGTHDGTTLANITTTNANLIGDTWYFIAWVYNPSTTWECYKNTIKTTRTLSGSIPSALQGSAAIFTVGAAPPTFSDPKIGLFGAYIFDGLAGRPAGLPSNYEKAIIQKIYNNTNSYYVDD